ncbi:DedA family protein [Thiomicrorhabdus cannonii]|uniref:DedA family protein n=1 Tax=Thiomicrorhabdus cannonii TaxID=2748011 RepID=UPI001FEB5F2E|nr:DedA family protein [Thiomicrorhabdus cannonii]
MLFDLDVEQIISQYGYWAILIGTFFEGEIILLIGGFLAHQDYLELHWVILTAFVGSLAGDQLFFYLGRRKGRQFIDNNPKWQAHADKVFAELQRHRNWLVISSRFLYGLRTVTPFVIGASGYPPGRFLALNMIGAAIWAISFGWLGYLIGQTLAALINEVKQIELYVLAGLIGLAVGLLVVRLIRKRRR